MSVDIDTDTDGLNILPKAAIVYKNKS